MKWISLFSLHILFAAATIDQNMAFQLCRSLENNGFEEARIKACIEEAGFSYTSFRATYPAGSVTKSLGLHLESKSSPDLFETHEFQGPEVQFAGLAIFAVELDNNKRGEYSRVITDPEDFCRFKNYDAVASASLGPMLFDRFDKGDKDVHQKGWEFKYSALGTSQDVYQNKEGSKRVMAYQSVTCIRAKTELAKKHMPKKKIDMQDLVTTSFNSRPVKAAKGAEDDAPRRIPAKTRESRPTTSHSFDKAF